MTFPSSYDLPRSPIIQVTADEMTFRAGGLQNVPEEYHAYFQIQADRVNEALGRRYEGR